MIQYSGNPDFQHDTGEGLGILLINLGTPDAPTSRAVRRYLAQFLSDPRVIELPRALWLPILHGVILSIRPPRTARNYRKIWTEDGSPLLFNSTRLADKLQSELNDRFRGPVSLILAMRYGNPSIDHALDLMRSQNIRRLLVLPLYPQYSATTTGSAFDAVTETLQRQRWLPEIRFINQYHDDSLYVDALANSIDKFWQDNGRAEHLLMSFHGLPRRYLLNGDPYHCQCQKTARLIAERLGVASDMWSLTFQSRVGREEWLRPYTDEWLSQAAKTGPRRVQVVCPGFAADCLETLEEIAIRERTNFLEAGGEQLEYIPALNDSDSHVDLLRALIERHTLGWPETAADWDAEKAAEETRSTAARAIELGANR